jgi:hypothetical protein
MVIAGLVPAISMIEAPSALAHCDIVPFSSRSPGQARR